MTTETESDGRLRVIALVEAAFRSQAEQLDDAESMARLKEDLEALVPDATAATQAMLDLLAFTCASVEAFCGEALDPLDFMQLLRKDVLA